MKFLKIISKVLTAEVRSHIIQSHPIHPLLAFEYLILYIQKHLSLSMALCVEYIVSVLHQDEGGIGKSIPEARKISRELQNVMTLTMSLWPMRMIHR